MTAGSILPFKNGSDIRCRVELSEDNGIADFEIGNAGQRNNGCTLRVPGCPTYWAIAPSVVAPAVARPVEVGTLKTNKRIKPVAVVAARPCIPEEVDERRIRAHSANLDVALAFHVKRPGEVKISSSELHVMVRGACVDGVLDGTRSAGCSRRAVGGDGKAALRPRTGGNAARNACLRPISRPAR